MHVPWGWIKQRPHFFAEKLSEYLDIEVYALEGVKNSGKYIHNKREEKRFRKHRLILSGNMHKYFLNNKFIQYIYQKWFRLQVRKFNTYDYIWVTNISLYKFIEKNISSSQILIYDCMDDDLEFPSIKNSDVMKRYLSELEKKLVSRANYILFSSTYLRQKVYSRCPFDMSKSLIVNNAIEYPNVSIKNNFIDPLEKNDIENKLNILKSKLPNIVYIGTIAEWFDFNTILKLLDKYKTLSCILVGPTEIHIPHHPRLIHLGSIERKYIFQVMQYSNALIMPFKITELIRSVNPVKLYEYVYSGKPIIAPEYEEIEQFKDYIYTYKSFDELSRVVGILTTGELKSKTSIKECKSFTRDNTWEKRIMDIIDFIELK